MFANWVAALRPALLLISFYPSAAGALRVVPLRRLWRHFVLSPAGLLCQGILLGIGATSHAIQAWATTAMMPAGSLGAEVTPSEWYARARPSANAACMPIKANPP